MSKKFIFFLILVFISSIYLSFTYFQRSSLAKIDEFYSEMKTSLIFPHGEERDSALPLNSPPLASAKSADFMNPEDMVIGVTYNGISRAYPIWIMVAYHIVNDNFGGKPLLVTHCEVCSGSGAFIPNVKETQNHPLSFTSCEYRNGTYSLCDMQTKSRWHPFSGISVAGALTGSVLKSVPLRLVKWKNWVRANPNTEVLFSNKDLKKRIHGRGPCCEVGSGYMTWIISMTSNLNDRRLKKSDLIFGIINLKSKKHAAISLNNVPDYTIQVVKNFNDSYLLVHTFDYDYQVFSLPNHKNEKYFFNKTQDGFLNDKGEAWDLNGKATSKSTRNFDLQVQNGYFAEWYEWVSSYPETSVIKLN